MSRFKYEVTKASENKIEFPRCRHYTWVCGGGGRRGCGKAEGVKSCEMLRDTYRAGSAAARHTE